MADPKHTKPCSVQDCNKHAHAKGYCTLHYQRYRKGADLATPARVTVRGGSADCSVDECERKSRSMGMCHMHYKQKWRTGSHERSRGKRPTGQWSDWYEVKSGYVQRHMWDGVASRIQFQHRAVMEEMLGRKLMRGENVHHVNGIRNDNRPDNLELWSTQQPAGQRVQEKIDWAKELLESYGYTVINP